MSQTTSAAPAPLPQPAQRQAGQPGQPWQPGQRGQTGQGPTTIQEYAAGAVRTFFAGTPGRLRTVLIVTAAVSVLFGLAAAQGFRQADGALQRADENTAQLVRIQAIQTNLVSANADATNAFLVGGLEPPAQRQHFTDSMNAAAGLIAEAAEAQPADTQALAALNKTLLTYQGLVEQARANNRQGLPVGTQYLKDASAALRTDAVPLLAALVAANENRVTQEFSGIGDGSTWLVVAGIGTLIVLVLALSWLAMRTHRYLNVPLLGAAAVVLLTIIIGGSSLSSAEAHAKDTRDESYARTLALSRARIAAYEAKSNESLTLIARGSGANFEKDWTTAAGTVDQQLVAAAGHGATSSPWTGLWNDYKQTHRAIRTADDNGKWEQAVQLAVGAGATSSNNVFTSFDRATSADLDKAAGDARGQLQDAGGSLPLLGWLGLPLGLAAALLAWWGLSQRLEEYR